MIEVRMPHYMKDRFAGYEVLFHTNLMLKLREKKVPVIGEMLILGVEFGRLTMFSEGTDFVYQFEEGEL